MNPGMPQQMPQPMPQQQPPQMPPQMQGMPGMPGQQNQNLAMFARMAQPQPTGAPAGMPAAAGQPPSPAGAPPAGGGGLPMPMPMPPGGGQHPAAGMQPTHGGMPGMPQPGGQKNTFTPQELAALGRYGDTMIAHLTPGEIAVPPQVQSPKVLATLNKEFEKSGVDMQQFTAGSQQSSVNPQSGIAEYNFLSAFLPAALGIAGSFAMPWLAPAMAPALAGAIGSGVGATAGGLLGGQDPMQALLAGAGAGAGGYLLGGLGGAGSGAADAAGGAVSPALASAQAGADLAAQGVGGGAIPADLSGTALSNAGGAASSASGPLNLWGVLPHDINPMAALGSAAGGYIGGKLGAPQTPTPAPKPAGFDDHFPSVDQLKPWDQALGQTSYNGPLPNFAGYNAQAPMASAWNFYPQRQ